MDVYIGMDISLQLTHVCVVDSEGKIMHEGNALSEVPALDAWLGKRVRHGLSNALCSKPGQLSTYLYHGLKAAGLRVLCIDARHANGTLKAQRIKTDKNDARGLAQLARTGWYKAVHVKSDDCQALRTLVLGRKQIVIMRLDMENHIRRTLKTFGIKLGTVTSVGFAAKVKGAIAGEDALVSQRCLLC